MIRVAFLVAALTQLSACCCCCGGSGDGSGGPFSDMIGEEIGEFTAEQMTGADEVEVDEATGRMEITGPDGTVVVEGEGDEGTITYSGEGGTFEIAGTGEIPADLPLPVYPGATPAGVMKTTTPEGNTYVVSLETSATFEEVVAFYEPKLGELGEVSRTDMSSGGTQMTQFMVDGESSSSMVMINHEGGVTTVALTSSPK